MILVFQDSGQSIAHLRPISGLVTPHVYEGQKLLVYHISTRYLYPRLTYYTTSGFWK